MRSDKKETIFYRKPSPVIYFLLRICFRLVSGFLYHPQVVRNEIADLEEPFVLIANHQSALDIVNIAIQYKKYLTIVFGNNYYKSLPLIARKLVDSCGVIHKQQFQTKPLEIQMMKKVIEEGNPLLIFPAGLMCEDGMTTPIPEATASFVKWLGVDVYMAKSTGAYFVMPKWSDKVRRGKTKIDIFKALSSAEIEELSEQELREKLDNILYFDAYEEQEEDRFVYKHGDETKGLENVVYQCPICKAKYTMVSDHNRLSCSACGFTQTMDTMGFMHCENLQHEIRHISAWTRWILSQREKEIEDDFTMNLPCSVSIMDGVKKGFRHAGGGSVTLNATSVTLDAVLNGKPCHIEKSVKEFPTLPFVPGKRFEIQDGFVSYRCFPRKPEMVMEWINTLKILHKKSYRHDNHQ